MKGESSSSEEGRPRGAGGLGESSSPKYGGEYELYRSPGAELYIIDGHESALLQAGDFKLFLVKQSRSCLAAVVAMVGDIQWPVGSDSRVMKVGDRRFTFALPPGLLYGLVLSEGCSASDLQQLDVLLKGYAFFEVHSDLSEGVGRQTDIKEQQAANYWTRVAGDVEPRNENMANQSRWWPGATSTIAGGGQMAALSLQTGELTRSAPGAASEKISPGMVRKMQQARRMSAVAKLFAKTLEKGAISQSTHVELAEGSEGLASGAGMSVASVEAVAKVLEAVESAGRRMLESAGTAGTAWVERRYGEQARQSAEEGLGAVGGLINSAWTLNKVGLRMLLRATAASTAINTAARTSSSFTSSPAANSWRPSSSDAQTTSGSLGSTSLLSSSSTSQSTSSPRFPRPRVLESSLQFTALPPPRHPPPPPPPPPGFHPPPPPPPTHPIFRPPPPPFHFHPGSSPRAPPLSTSPFRQPLHHHRSYRHSPDAAHRPRPQPRSPQPQNPSV